MFSHRLKEVLARLLIALVSVFVFHLLAFVGFFIVVSYLFWGLVFPKRIWCFSCRTKKTGQHCSWCHRKISGEADRYPKTRKSFLLNVLLIIIMCFLSLGAVKLELFVFKQLDIFGPDKTAAFVVPNRRNYNLQEIFPFEIDISGIQTPINAVQVDLQYDASRLQVVNVDIEDSFASIFIDKQVDNENGFLRLTGGLPNPGFNQETGTFATVYFQGVSPGPVKVSFLPSSLVMANDGQGSNVLQEYRTISYLISNEELSETEQQLQFTQLDPSVLGAKTKSDKIVLFGESPSTAKSTLTKVSKPKAKNVFQSAGNALMKYNQFVLGFWGRTLRMPFL